MGRACACALPRFGACPSSPCHAISEQTARVNSSTRRPARRVSLSCMHGDWCAFAHGVDDLRLHAAIRCALLCCVRSLAAWRCAVAVLRPPSRPTTASFQLGCAAQLATLACNCGTCIPILFSPLSPCLQGPRLAGHVPHTRVPRSGQRHLPTWLQLPLCTQPGGQAAAADHQRHAVRCVQGELFLRSMYFFRSCFVTV